MEGIQRNRIFEIPSQYQIMVDEGKAKMIVEEDDEKREVTCKIVDAKDEKKVLYFWDKRSTKEFFKKHETEN